MVIGIIIGLAVLIYGAMKGWSIIILAPIGALIAAATSGKDLLPMYTMDYMTGVGEYIIKWFPMFLMGAIFGEVMKESGAAASIARKIINKLGEKYVIFTLMLATVVLVVGGVSIFCIIFVLYPLMLMCFKEADIPKYLMPGTIIAGIIVSESAVPGNPQIQNIIPTQMLGVSPMAGPIIGFSSFVIMFIMCLVYLNFKAKKAREAGITFIDDKNEMAELNTDESTLPNFWLSLLPIVLIIVLLNVVKINVIVSMACGIVFTVVLFFGRLKKNIIAIFNKGAMNSIPAIMNTATAVGFGSVIKVLPGFDNIVGGLNKVVKGNPYLFAFVAVNILALVAGSASGGMTIALNAVGDKLLASGANPNALARIVAISSVGLDSLPHNGAVITILTYCGVTHKDGYKPMFVVSVLVPVVVGLYAVILANIGIV
nr:GntP family permease [Sedimentibacter sp.]